ncbi:hypothetical protein HDU96_005728 [Phlyctochytrium bullatum]|nr:hypothetical protein HDU96_005728 [Phlyctochytrium bullatum]
MADMDLSNDAHMASYFNHRASSVGPNGGPPSVGSGSFVRSTTPFPGSFDRPQILPPMGPLSDFPDMDTAMAQVRAFLERSGQTRCLIGGSESSVAAAPGAGSTERAPSMSVEPVKFEEDEVMAARAGFGHESWGKEEIGKSWGDHLPPPAGGWGGSSSSGTGFGSSFGADSMQVDGHDHDDYRAGPSGFGQSAGGDLIVANSSGMGGGNYTSGAATTSSGWYPPPPNGLSSALSNRLAEFDDRTAEDDPALLPGGAAVTDAGDDTPTDPTQFLYSVLMACHSGLRSIHDHARTVEVIRAMAVCRLGMDYISIIDNGVAKNEVQTRSMMLAYATGSNAGAAGPGGTAQPGGASSPAQVGGTAAGTGGKGKGRKGAGAGSGRGKHKALSAAGATTTPGRRSLTLPAEILLRVFSFLSEPDSGNPTAGNVGNAAGPPGGVIGGPGAPGVGGAVGAAGSATSAGGPGPAVPASALYTCSLVCRQWDLQASTELWKRVTMDDDAPRLGRFVLSLAATSLSGRNRGSMVRVISVACTDAELSLLALGAGKLPGLHSLELRRSFIPNAGSYRLLSRLRNRFPSLRSLVADMIPPTALPDIISIVRGATLLSNLHISIGPPDLRLGGVPSAAAAAAAAAISAAAVGGGAGGAGGGGGNQGLAGLGIAGANVGLGAMGLGAAAMNMNAAAAAAAAAAATSLLSPEPIQSLLWKIPNLRSISFWRVGLPRDEGLWVPALAQSCPSLKAIRIDDCGDVSMDILVGLWRRCDLLECVAMRKVKRRTAFTELVPRLPMRRVVLDGCWMNDSLLAAIGGNAPNLEVFYIEDDWADDDFKHPLAPTVVNELTDEGVLELARYQHNLRAITFIGFPGRRNFRASSLRQLLEANPSCFALNLARMDPHWPYRMSDGWLLELAPALKNIEVLELYVQSGVTEDGLLETLRRAALAASMEREAKAAMAAAAVAAAASGQPMQAVVAKTEVAGGTVSFVGSGKIRRLGLSGWSQLSDRTLYCLPVLCPRLERLDMAGANVTAQGLQSLVDAASRLRECVVTVPPVDMENEGAVEMSDPEVGVGGVRWGKVMQYDDPVSEDVFSPYSVWEREVRRLGKKDGIIY